jgi:hypothetical protein
MRLPGASIVIRRHWQARRGLADAKLAPRPAPKADSRRVLVDVGEDLVEVALVRDHAGLEAALEEMPGAVVPAVEADRVQAVQPLHAARELGLRRLDQQVEVVVEQDPDVNRPAEPGLDLEQQLVPGLAVEVVQHDRPLLDSAADHVVPRGARELRARDAWHPAEASAARRSAKPSSWDVSQGQSLGHVRFGFGGGFRADCG